MAGNQDMRAASETYSGFLSLLKWGTIVSVAVAAFVVLIIA
ncbi:aa3-type cytochrome c oxidase subunit IV [Sphingorhabdus sp.]